MAERIPAEVFPPGEFIRDELEERGWKIADLAEILGRPIPVIHALLSGKTGITPETARGLGAAFDQDPEVWLNLDAVYRLSLLREPRDDVAIRARLYEKAPVREMVRRGWIEPSKNVTVLERQILEFFNIEDLDDEPELWPSAARRSTNYAEFKPPLRAWLVRAKQLSEDVSVGTYKAKQFRSLLDALTLLQSDPEETRKVPAVLADAGIRCVVVEPLATTRIDGACLWLDSASPAVALSLRYDRIDSFWFTLLHELFHVHRNDGLNEVNPVDVDLVGASRDREKPSFETEVDDLAANTLVPSQELDDFVKRVGPLYSKDRIVGFAKRLQIHPGIVVGQLQFRGQVPWTHYRQFLEPVKEFVTASALTDGWGHVPG